jgi:hypothetical protein
MVCSNAMVCCEWCVKGWCCTPSKPLGGSREAYREAVFREAAARQLAESRVQELEAQLQAQTAWEEMATESLLREGALLTTLRMQLFDQQAQQQGVGLAPWQAMPPTLQLPDPGQPGGSAVRQLAAMPAPMKERAAPEEGVAAPMEEGAAPEEEERAAPVEEGVDLRRYPFGSPIPSSQPEEDYGEAPWPTWR